MIEYLLSGESVQMYNILTGKPEQGTVNMKEILKQCQILIFNIEKINYSLNTALCCWQLVTSYGHKKKKVSLTTYSC